MVKANGQVRPEAGISSVRNMFGGEILEVNFEQGQVVKKGDILFSIKHDSLVVEKDSFQQQLDTYKVEFENLKKYRNSVVQHINEFDPDKEPVYYQKVNKFLLDMDSALNDADFRNTKLQEELQINQDKLSYLNTEIVHVMKYIESLDSLKNEISQKDQIGIQYHQKFEGYIILRRDLERRFDQQALDIKSSNYESIGITLEEDKALLAAFAILKNSIMVGKSLFPEFDKYSGLYEDYVFKVSQFQNTYDEAQSIYTAYKALEGLGVSEVEVVNSENLMEKAKGDLESFKINFSSDLDKTIQEKELSIKNLESRLSGSLDQESYLNLNEEDKNNALRKLYLNERQAMYDAEENTRDTINSLRLSIKLSEVELAANNTETIEGNVSAYTTLERLKAQELVTTDDRIKAISDNIKSFEQSIKKSELDIKNAIVTASINGIVNVIKDIYTGDFLSSGEEILTIIPENNTAYTMQVYVGNKDIGEIKVGDSVKYNFAALPSREYGEMRGVITSISEDALSNQASGQSYYIVESTVPGAILITPEGKQGEIKVGMLCEANIITKQKSIIRFLLEKIDLVD